MVAARNISSGDTEGTLTGRVQHLQIGDSASTTSLEGDDRLHYPPIIFDDELTASRAFALLLLPEFIWEATSL